MKPVQLIGIMLLAIALGVGIGLVVKGTTPVATGNAVDTESAPTGIDAVAQEVLTPGGLYTQADIEANGNVSPFDKYARAMMGDPGMEHQKPQVGDVRCPVTGSKGTMTWIIGGRTYYFCCPPCIIEYVRKAKTDPDSIPPPEEYLVTAENIGSLPEPTM